MARLALGAPGDVYSPLRRPGKIHLLLGPLSGTISAGDADVTWWATGAGAGLALGDGQPDLAVGAARMPTNAGDDAGRVYLLSAFGP